MITFNRIKEKLHQAIPLARTFFHKSTAFLITILLFRILEYYLIGIKYFNLNNASTYEIYGLFYDIWAWLVYCGCLFLVFAGIYRVNKTIASAFLHTANCVMIFFYFATILLYSQRAMPFDHEIFVRKFGESLATSRVYITGNWQYLVFLALAILLYATLHRYALKHLSVGKSWLAAFFILVVLGSATAGYAMPKPAWFNSVTPYYLTSNKVMYWAVDSFAYFTRIDAFKRDSSSKAIAKEIEFYQEAHGFEFISRDYPLLRIDDSKDILGPYFNLGKTPPNIVILVVESLSNDFSGKTAKPASFTPYLDSIADSSLYWENFLSCSTGSFGVYPAILASTPYGEKGFSLQETYPDHNSLIKILRRNGYFSYFNCGFDLEYYNLASFIKQQGTDFILSDFGPRYKMQGIGPDGWSEGYPDEALFQKGFEVLDTLGHTPYLNMYFTLTTHEPYLFDESPIYEKKFMKKLNSLHLKNEERDALLSCKALMRTVMYTDDCIQRFFENYKLRKEYNNTIFLITGDHHDGMYPGDSEIDNYHVPFMIYSPMLKKPMRFESVNTHNNVAPSILALLDTAYRFQYMPNEVHWVADGLDTNTAFRCEQKTPLQYWSGGIENYVYNNHFLAKDALFTIEPGLKLTPCDNQALKDQIARMRDNYLYINSYVCSRNRLFPPNAVQQWASIPSRPE